MPLMTQTVQGYELIVNFAGFDTNGKLVSRDKTYEMVGATQAAVDTAVNAFLTDLGAVTEAQIIGHRVTRVSATVDVIPTTQVTLRKELVLSLQSGVSVLKKLFHTLYAPADAILTGGTTVDPANAAVVAWLANYVAAGNVRISDGEFLSDAANPIMASRVRNVASGKTY